MQKLRARVTSKGQVTIPVYVRRRLGVEPGDEISFAVEDGAVRIEVSGESVVERTAGALKGKKSAGNLREAAERAIAEEVAEGSEG